MLIKNDKQSQSRILEVGVGVQLPTHSKMESKPVSDFDNSNFKVVAKTLIKFIYSSSSIIHFSVDNMTSLFNHFLQCC